MATPLDISLISSFMPVFSWIFAFLLVYGVMEVTNIFRNRGIHAMVAFVFSLMVALSGNATRAITSMTPWFLVMIFFVFMIYLVANFMGISSGDIVGALGGKSAIWWILIVGIVILASGLSQTFGQQLLEARTGGNESTTVGTGTVGTGNAGTGTSSSHGYAVLLILTNAKVLGMILLFLIAALTVSLMTMPIK